MCTSNFCAHNNYTSSFEWCWLNENSVLSCTVLVFISAVTQKYVVYLMPGILLIQIPQPKRTQNVFINQLEMLKTFEPVCLGMVISSVSDV